MVSTLTSCQAILKDVYMCNQHYIRGSTLLFPKGTLTVFIPGPLDLFLCYREKENNLLNFYLLSEHIGF